MKCLIYYVCCIILICLCTSCAEDGRANKIYSIKGNVERGDLLYVENCIGCHAHNIRGSIGPSLVNKFSTREIAINSINIILEGSGKMQSYADLSDQEIADLIAYIKSKE